MKKLFCMIVVITSIGSLAGQRTINDYICRWRYENNANDERGGHDGVFVNGSCPSNLIIFPVPEQIPGSNDYTVKVNNQSVFCYSTYRLDNLNATTSFHNTPVSESSFVQFDFTGCVTVEVTPRPGLIVDVNKVVVRPLFLNIQPDWDGIKFTFTLSKPVDFTIDVQGDGMNPLHFFTNYPETDIPDPDDPNVLYFDPGIHHVNQIVLASNQTLYLAGGAVLRPVSPQIPNSNLNVHGENWVRGLPLIATENTVGVTIKGRGIISAADATQNHIKVSTIQSNTAINLSIKDVILMDANDWNIHLYNSQNLTLDKVRILGYFINSDGICFNCSKTGLVKNCFIHTMDDSFEVKAGTIGKTSSDITFDSCLVWNDYASSIGVTHEVLGRINNITWQNITIMRFNPVVHDNWQMHRAAIFVHAQGGGKVSDLTFNNIVIEKTDTKQAVILVDNIKTTVPDINTFPDKDYNQIENIYFNNINGYDISTPRVIVYDESNMGIVKNIYLNNVILNGAKLINNDPRLRITGAQNVFVQ